MARRIRRNIWFYTVKGPLVMIIIEEPSHLKPYGILICICKTLIDLSTDTPQILWLPTWRSQLIKKIDAIDVISTVDTGFCINKLLLDFLKKRIHGIEETAGVLVWITRPCLQFRDFCLGKDVSKLVRNMTGKSRQDRTHIQLTLTGGNFLLQFKLSIKPRLGKWSAPIINIEHSVPWQVSRTCKIGTHFLIRQSIICPDLIPNGFLTCNGKRKINAIQCHPVDEVLPLIPFPPRHCIPKCTIIQEEAVFNTRFNLDCLGYRWHG